MGLNCFIIKVFGLDSSSWLLKYSQFEKLNLELNKPILIYYNSDNRSL